MEKSKNTKELFVPFILQITGSSYNISTNIIDKKHDKHLYTHPFVLLYIGHDIFSSIALNTT